MLCHLEYNCFSNMLQLFIGHYTKYFLGFTEIDLQEKRKQCLVFSQQATLPTKAMLVWLGAHICNWLAIWLYFSVSSPSDFISTVIISPPLQLPCQKGQPWYRCFHSTILNCLPPLICVLKHICMN